MASKRERTTADAADGADTTPTGTGAKGKARTKKAAPTAPRTPREVKAGDTTRTGTKQAELIGMLKAVNGATVGEIAEALGWQPHTVRGAIAGALRKRLGLNVSSEKAEGRGRVYRIAD